MGEPHGYRALLRLDELLELPLGLADGGDELLFCTIHQAAELWFQVIIDHLACVRSCTREGELHTARRALQRVVAIERSLVDQITILGMVGPAGFNRFRGRLGSTSALQSAQFRLIEFMSRPGDPRYLNVADASPRQRAALNRCLTEPSLYDTFMELVERRGATLSGVYADPHCDPDLHDLAELLVDHDETFSMWRMRHYNLVARMIGSSSGTAGTAGLRFLERTLTERFFPELWSAREEVARRAQEPV